MVEDLVKTVRMPDGLIKQIEVEMRISGRNNNFSEFIKDAVKFYLRDQAEYRRIIEICKKKSVEETDDMPDFEIKNSEHYVRR